jgi:hypothetical protein
LLTPGISTGYWKGYENEKNWLKCLDTQTVQGWCTVQQIMSMPYAWAQASFSYMAWALRQAL